jgi:hypothetical protein
MSAQPVPASDQPGKRRRRFPYIQLQELQHVRPDGVAHLPEFPTDAELNQAIDAFSPPLAALCLSGGGIRSASFALGIIQGLARFRVLGEFDYLSTVSGGGYMGSFLSAWRVHLGGDNTPGSDEKLCAALDRPAHPQGKEAAEIKGIRAYSNYLTPRIGAFSADSWTLVALVIRNLLLNWMVFLPLFMGVLVIPRFCAALLATIAGGLQAAPLPFFVLGILAAIVGFAYASFGRQYAGGAWLTNHRFFYTVVVPLAIASMFFTTGIGCIATQCAFSPKLYYYGLAAGAVAYLIAAILGTTACGIKNRRDKAHAVAPDKDAAEPAPPRCLFHLLDGRICELLKNLAAWAFSGAVVGLLMVAGIDFVATPGGSNPTMVDPDYGFMTIAGICWFMLSVLAGELLFVGLRSYSPRGDMDREWLARSAGWLTAIAVIWAVFAAAALLGPDVFDAVRARIGIFATMAISAAPGAISVLIGNSGKTPAQAEAVPASRFSLVQVASTAALVFALLLAILVATLDREAERTLVTDLSLGSITWLDLALQIGLILVSIGISYFINVNRFSLHAIYRNRLVRAYLGSARADAHIKRNEDPFTDFDQTDNIRMAKLPKKKLFHVVNTTLNLAATKNLAWQQRKAESFTITPLSTGNPNVRYRPSDQFASSNGGITLGTAMAISGAAVSPNMGSHTSPLVCFLLMLTNLRLGWWLGNPKKSCYMKESPGFSIVAMLQELAGQTNDDGNWIYLSDGGHFDNLGLYEMVRRRCRLIVVSDAGEDPQCTLSDLGDSLRKIYIDLGVSIDFDDFEIKPRQTPPVLGKYGAIARITYPGTKPGAEPGWLLYIKTSYYGDERTDVRSYAEAHKAFPNESTTNQWFSESQLESYRALGAHIMELICNGGKSLMPHEEADPIGLRMFMKRAEQATKRESLLF